MAHALLDCTYAASEERQYHGEEDETFGLLYERSLYFLVAFSVIAQLDSLPIFFWADRANRKR
jgi:hypothetical protein